MKRSFLLLVLTVVQLFFSSVSAESLTSMKCKESNDGMILQPILEKLDGTLNSITKIPQENIDELKIQESIITTLKLTRGNIDMKRINQEYSSLSKMKYYPQWEYINQLNKIKRKINYILELENKKSKTPWLEDNPYYKKNQKIDINVLGLDLAIDANTLFSEFKYTYFNGNSSNSKIFNDVDSIKYEMLFNGSYADGNIFEKYMHCKLARIVEKN